MIKRRSSAEIIAFHFGYDINDIRGSRYQPTRYAAPAVYTVGEDYYCAPSGSQKPPKGWNWKPLATYYGRAVFVASSAIVD